MTLSERLARIPTDRHIRYETRHRGETPTYLARWRGDDGHWHAVSLGYRLPATLPDRPCPHRGNAWTWREPKNDAERQEAIERGRRANAMRRKHSNKWIKLQEKAS